MEREKLPPLPNKARSAATSAHRTMLASSQRLGRTTARAKAGREAWHLRKSIRLRSHDAIKKKKKKNTILQKKLKSFLLTFSTLHPRAWKANDLFFFGFPPGSVWRARPDGNANNNRPPLGCPQTRVSGSRRHSALLAASLPTVVFHSSFLFVAPFTK